MAYYNQIPSCVEFSQPFSDGSGKRITVAFAKNKDYVTIETSDEIDISKSDIDWLIEVLKDCRELYKESLPKP